MSRLCFFLLRLTCVHANLAHLGSGILKLVQRLRQVPVDNATRKDYQTQQLTKRTSPATVKSCRRDWFVLLVLTLCFSTKNINFVRR